MNSAASSSDEPFDTLAELLDVHAAFDIEGLLGLLHAVAVAPALVMPSTWFQRILSEEGEPGVLRPPKHGAPLLDATTFNDLTTLITGLYNEVLHCIGQNGVLVPRADDVDGCESFAEGYIAGAQLVPEWIGNEACWNLVGPFAYLADQLDLVPRELIAGIEDDFGPNPKQGIRDSMCDLVLDTNDAFDEYRRASIPPTHTQAPGPRIGRNDPCPCGSGKKYKKCCATRAASPT